MPENFDLTNNLILTIIKQFDSGKKKTKKPLQSMKRKPLKCLPFI